MEEIKKRSDAIDIIKGLSILTLFFLHFENGWMDGDINYFIVRSPAFYIVVGWLWGMSSNRRTINEHWEKRKKGLVTPYIYFSLIFIMLDLILVTINAIDPFILYRDIYKTLCFRGIGTLWFLPALLGGEMLLLSTRNKSWFLKIVSYLLCFSVIYIYYYWKFHTNYSSESVKDIINAPFQVLDATSYAFIYISIAYYFSRHRGNKIFNETKNTLFLIGLIFIAIGFYIFNFINIKGIIQIIMLIIGGSITGFGALLFFRAIEGFKLLLKPLVYFGKNSLIVMTMHWFLLQIALCIDYNIFHNEVFTGFRTVIYFLISLFVLIGIIELINKKFKFIIGK